VTLELRSQIRRGGLRGAAFVAWLQGMPPGERDAAVERLLGIEEAPPQEALGDGRMGYMPAGIAAVMRTVLDAPIGPGDVLVDLGAGLGKVAMAVHLLTGARARGIEVQPALVARARERAHDLAIDVAFTEGDALEADLEGGTIYFLYLPFIGDVLTGVLARLRAIAEQRPIVVCALGLDLHKVDWLVERPTQEFWLAIYDSQVHPGAGAARATPPRPSWAPAAEDVAGER
jgi:SAM-dependent methyltransferase